MTERRYPVRTEGPMYKYQMPTEVLSDQVDELKTQLDRITEEYDKIIAEKDERIAELEKRDAELTRLENGGVDNWEGYEFAVDEG